MTYVYLFDTFHRFARDEMISLSCSNAGADEPPRSPLPMQFWSRSVAGALARPNQLGSLPYFIRSAVLFLY